MDRNDEENDKENDDNSKGENSTQKQRPNDPISFELFHHEFNPSIQCKQSPEDSTQSHIVSTDSDAL